MLLRTIQQSKAVGSLLRISVAVGLTLGLIACSGEDGSPGLDGVSPDVTPPSIALLSPAAGDTARDTLRVVASAVDNIAIKRVVFYLDGSDRINDTTFAEISGLDAVDNQYVWTFDLLELGIKRGVHSIMARAIDVDRNQADTPTIFVHTEYEIPLGNAVLRTWEPDSTGFMKFPNRQVNDPAIILDSDFSTRFRPERDCQVNSVRIYLTGDLNVFPELDYDTTLTVEIYESDGVYPLLENGPLGEGVLDVMGLDSTGWFSAAIADVDLPADRFFHVSVNGTVLSETTTFGMGVSIVDKYDYPTHNHSARYRLINDAWYWESMEDPDPNPEEEISFEFMIEVWVTYF
jgi:Bacterial Ig domain